MPKSIPVSCPVDGSGCRGTSAQEKLTYQPSASREIVTVLGVPSSGRDQRSASRPGQDQEALVQRRSIADLLVGQGVIAIAPLKAGVAGCLASLHAAKEGWKGALKAREHILQNLRMRLPVFGTCLLDSGQLSALTGSGDADAAFPPGLLAFLQSSIIEFTAAAQDKFHCPLLFGGRLEVVLEGLAHRLLVQMDLFCLIVANPAGQEGHSSPA
jgi:hypothetical protein